MATKYLFCSYARVDYERVMPLVGLIQQELASRSADVQVWVDLDFLKPGQSWQLEIGRALQDSVGIVVFVSRASMESSFVTRELTAFASDRSRLIIPVILDHVDDLPTGLAERQWIDLSHGPYAVDPRGAAKAIVDATFHQAGHAAPPVTRAGAPELASRIADEVRQPSAPKAPGESAPRSIFVVHGHDLDALSQIETFLKTLEIEPIVLSKLRGPAQFLWQKFSSMALEARFAVVLLSPDDLGASLDQYEEVDVRDKALQFRARQNVILELGFFYGHLGWENVFVLVLPAKKKFPNFERPSDLDGILFPAMDATGQWRERLMASLRDAGFPMDGARTEP